MNLLVAQWRNQGPGAWLNRTSPQQARRVGKLDGEWQEEALARQPLWLRL